MKRNIILGLLIAGIGIVFTFWLWPQNDESITKILVGTWRADDPNNGALHKQSEGVKNEQVTFYPDGTLIYTVESDADDQPTKTEHWGWRVRGGRLQVQYLGEGNTQAWMRPVKCDCSQTKFSIRRKNYPAKVFTRIKEADSVTSHPA